jgi:hypothetical protein
VPEKQAERKLELPRLLKFRAAKRTPARRQLSEGAPATDVLLYASGLRRQTIRCDRFRRGRSRDALCSFEHHKFSVRGSVRYPKALFASAAAMVGGVVIDARTRWSFEYVVLSLVHDGGISGIGCSGNNLCMDAFARRPLRE